MPIVVVMAERMAAQHGLVFKSTHVVEVVSKTLHVVFDKTGTLTQGKLSVQAEEYSCGRRNAMHVQLLGLVAGTKHPVAIAIAAHNVAHGTEVAEVEDIRFVVGKGVEAMLNGVRIRAGNSWWR